MFTIVDTPGFGDSQSHEMENTKINEMLNVLKTSIKGANAIILLFNGEQIRFDHAFQQTIRYIFLLNYIVLVIWIPFKFYFSEKLKPGLENHSGILQ